MLEFGFTTKERRTTKNHNIEDPDPSGVISQLKRSMTKSLPKLAVPIFYLKIRKFIIFMLCK